MRLEFYEHILQGSEATEENAKDTAKNLVWYEVTKTDQHIAYLDYVDTINGIDIWYCYGNGSYCFSDNEQ